MSEPNRWAKRAMAHGRVLCRGIGPRGAASDEEQRAAEYVRDELQRLRLQAVRVEPFGGTDSAWLPWAIAFSLTIWGVLIGLIMAQRGGEIIALAFFLLAAWIAYRELYPTIGSGAGSPPSGAGTSSGGFPIRRWLWQGDSQNVIGVVSPSGPVERRVVLMSYLDSARAPFFWRTQRRRRLVGCLALPILCSLPCSGATLMLGAMTGNAWFYPLAILVSSFPSIGLIASLRAGRSPLAPGANNNASGVGALLALAERLQKAPLAHTEVWLLATGCRETGGDGARAFLRTHGETLAQATFVALEGVGVGEWPVYLTGEGRMRQTHYSSKTLALAAQAAERCREAGLDVSPEHHQGGPTEMGIITREGLDGVTINVWADLNGVAGRRQEADTFDTLEKKALADALTFAWALLQEIDAD